MTKATAPKRPSLDAQVKDYFGRRVENGVEGLKILVTCIERTAKNRDWDALSRFMTLAGKSESSRARVVKIVRAAFGDKLTYKSNAKHDTGGTMAMGWEGAFPLSQSNTWGIVRDAANKGLSWTDPAFLKELPGPTAKARTVDAAATEKAAKHLAKYLLEREAEGFTIGDILSMADAEIRAKRVESKPIAAVTKKVVNGAEVIDVPH
jgi:hypothetical protein